MGFASLALAYIEYGPGLNRKSTILKIAAMTSYFKHELRENANL